MGSCRQPPLKETSSRATGSLWPVAWIRWRLEPVLHLDIVPDVLLSRLQVIGMRPTSRSATLAKACRLSSS